MDKILLKVEGLEKLEPAKVKKILRKLGEQVQALQKGEVSCMAVSGSIKFYKIEEGTMLELVEKIDPLPESWLQRIKNNLRSQK